MSVRLRSVIDGVALVYAVLAFPVPIFWLVIHPAIHFWRRFGKRSYWVALPVWILPAVLLVLARHRIFGARLGPNAWTASLGFALLLLGSWVNLQARRDLGLQRTEGLPEMNPTRYPGGVVSTGIYSRIRHPRYLGLMLGSLGFALLTGAIGFFLLAILTVLLYQMVARLEERVLREQYGAQYEDYARAVPRFVPRLLRKRTPRT